MPLGFSLALILPPQLLASAPSPSLSEIKFLDLPAGQQAGLFGFANGSLFRIAGTGDTKKENVEDESKTVSTVDFQPDAIDGNVLAYTAYFTDGSSAA